MDEKTITIRFHDYAENQEGFAIVRRFEEKVALCLSLEDNGDVETLVEKKIVEQLIEALRESIT